MAGVSTAWKPGDRFSLADDGFSGPIKVFTPDQCALVVRHWRHAKGKASGGWYKSSAAADRFFFDLASRPPILALLRPALGNDIVLWGASVVERTPGRVHAWHTDIESAGGEGFVSVWIGLENTSLESSLKFIPGSHRYGKPVQQLAYERAEPDGAATDETVLGWARALDASAEIVQPEAADGDALFFDGRIWHGSHNTRSEGGRIALLLQYAVAGTQVRKPHAGQFEWPFRFDDEPPPVVVVSGTADASRNNVVRAPDPNRASRDRAPAVCQALEFPLAEDRETGWKPYKIFHGATPNAQSMSAHVSVLSPGFTPHPPHAHIEEEVLVVLDGEAEILIGDSPDPATARVERVPAGAFSYYPAYRYHTIRNAGAFPVTYLMFKWRGAPAEIERQAEAGIFRFSDLLIEPGPVPAKGYRSKKFFEQPTGYLKRLQAHVTAMENGAGYAPHADAHDVAIIVLSGRVAAADTTLGANNLFYFPAGEMHGMKCVGDGPARYLVFEFHSPAPGHAVAAARSNEKKRKKPWAVLFLENAWRWLTSPLRRVIDRAVDRRLAKLFGVDVKELRGLRGLLRKELNRR